MPKLKNVSKASKKGVTAVPLSPKAITEKQTRNQIIIALAEETKLHKKEVQLVLETMGGMIHRHMKKRGSGEFTIPYTGVRIMRKTRPATPKRQGRNPATGESITIAAKPARTVIKVRILKSLKDTLNKTKSES